EVYRDVLRRAADPEGLTFWSGLVDRGLPRQLVAQQIAQSVEHQAVAVNDLYQRYLGRLADAPALAALTTFLTAGGGDRAVGVSLTSSDEYFAKSGGTAEGFVQALYRDALGREAGAGEQAVLGQALRSGLSRLQLADAVFVSAEYLRGQTQG